MAEDDRLPHEATFEAVERGRAFVARMEARARARDWRRVLGEMRKALTELAGSPIVRDDPVCGRILAAMAEAADMEELDFLADQLARRVADVIEARRRAEAEAAQSGAAARGGAAETVLPLPRAADPVRAPLPSALARAGAPETLAAALDDAGDQRRTRKVLKL